MLKKILKALGILVGALIVLLIIAYIGIFFASESMVNKTYNISVQVITIPTDAASIDRGKHLVSAVSDCVGCHGSNFAGGVIFEDPPVGRIVAPNLTKGKGGLGGQLSDADFIRVIRHGVMPDGKSVRVMPADDFTYLADSDLASIIAYVKSMPPVDSNLPSSEMGPLGRILLVTGQLPFLIRERINLNAARPTTVGPAANAQYGEYLTHVAGCVGCHGPGFSGGTIIGTPPGFPMAANITPAGAPANWSEADFIQTLRTGKDPTGHQLLSEMPWMTFRSMDDVELKALWAYLKTVPPRPFGNH